MAYHKSTINRGWLAVTRMMADGRTCSSQVGTAWLDFTWLHCSTVGDSTHWLSTLNFVDSVQATAMTGVSQRLSWCHNSCYRVVCPLSTVRTTSFFTDSRCRRKDCAQCGDHWTLSDDQINGEQNECRCVNRTVSDALSRLDLPFTVQNRNHDSYCLVTLASDLSPSPNTHTLTRSGCWHILSRHTTLAACTTPRDRHWSLRGCQPSVTELFWSPPLVSGTVFQSMSRQHRHWPSSQSSQDSFYTQ